MSINSPDDVAIDIDWWEQRKAGFKRIIQAHCARLAEIRRDYFNMLDAPTTRRRTGRGWYEPHNRGHRRAACSQDQMSKNARTSRKSWQQYLEAIGPTSQAHVWQLTFTIKTVKNDFVADGDFTLATAANWSMITGILRVSSSVFSDEIKIRSSNLSEAMLTWTADFTMSNLLCATSHNEKVTGSVSKTKSTRYR